MRRFIGCPSECLTDHRPKKREIWCVMCRVERRLVPTLPKSNTAFVMPIIPIRVSCVWVVAAALSWLWGTRMSPISSVNAVTTISISAPSLWLWFAGNVPAVRLGNRQFSRRVGQARRESDRRSGRNGRYYTPQKAHNPPWRRRASHFFVLV